MLKQYLEIGKIVGTHGVRGEVRAECWCDSLQFFSAIKKLYFNEGEEKIDVTSRPHKSMALVKIKGVDTVEQADLLRGRVLYVNRKDIKLPKGANFIQDILELEVTDADTGQVYGKVSDVIKTGANDVYEVKNSSGKTYYVPVIGDVVIETSPKKGKVLIRPMKGIFDDED